MISYNLTFVQQEASKQHRKEEHHATQQICHRKVFEYDTNSQAQSSSCQIKQDKDKQEFEEFIDTFHQANHVVRDQSHHEWGHHAQRNDVE